MLHRVDLVQKLSQTSCSESHLYGLLDNWLPKMVKLLSVVHECFRKQNILIGHRRGW